MGSPSPAGGLGSGSLSSSKEKSEVVASSPAAYAAEVVKEYKESPEKPKSMFGRALSFLSESVHKLNEGGLQAVFKDWIDKISVKENFNKAKEFFKDMPIIGKLFDLAEWVIGKFTDLKKDTVNGVLETVFGKILPAGAIAGLATAIGSKIGLDELLKFKDKPAELGAFLAQKVKDGTLEVKDSALWEQLSGALGGLPPLAELVSKGKEKLGDFAETIGLNDLRSKILPYLDSEFPGWKTNPAMAWVLDLNDPAKVAEAIGANLSDPSTWELALKGGTKIATLGGGYLLLNRLIGSKWAGRITLNAALYLFLQDNDVYKAILGGVDKVREIETRVCGNINQRLNSFSEKFNVDLEWFDIKKGNFGIADALKTVADKTNANPELAFLALEGAWLTRHVFTWIFGKALSLAKDSLGYAYRHPDKAVSIGAFALIFGGTGYVERRKLVRDLANVFFDTQKERDDFIAYVEDFSKGKFWEFKKDAPETYGEKTLDPLYERLMKAPGEFFADPEFKIQLFKRIAEGKASLKLEFLPEGVQVALGIGQMASPTWHLLNLEMGVAESMLMELGNTGDPNQNVDIAAFLTMAGGGYVIGKAMVGSAKGRISLLDDIHGPDRLKRFVKSFVPLTDEYRAVWFTALRDAGDSISFGQITTLRQASAVRNSAFYVRKLIYAANNSDSIETNKYQDLVKKVARNFSEGAGYLHYQDLQLQKELEFMVKLCDDVNDGVRNPAGSHASELRASISRVERRLSSLESRFSRLLLIGRSLANSEFKIAWSETKRLAFGGSRQAIDVEKVLEGKTEPNLRIRLDELTSEMQDLSPNDPYRIALLKERQAIRAYLDPADASLLTKDPNFDKLTGEAKAAKLAEMASEMEAVEKGIQARVTAKADEIIKAARAANKPLNSPEVIEQLNRLQETLVNPFARQKLAFLESINRGYKSLPKKLRGDVILREQIHLANENSFLTRVVKGAKGRAALAVVMLGAMFVTDQLINQDEADRDFEQIIHELGPDAKQLLIDVLPVVGTGSSFYSAISGRELMTDRDVSGGWQRASNVLWGFVGLAGDVVTGLTLIPSASTSLEANAALRLAKSAKGGSRAAQKVLSLWPDIARIADRMGGWKNFIKRLVGFKESKALRYAVPVLTAAAATVTVGGVVASLRYGTSEDMALQEFPEEMSGIFSNTSGGSDTNKQEEGGQVIPMSPLVAPGSSLSDTTSIPHSQEADIETAGMSQAA